MPSNLIIAAVTAFKNLVNSIQGAEDAGQQLRQTTASLGEVANVLEQLAASTAAHEQQYFQLDQRVGQTVQQVQHLQQGVQNAQTTANEARTATTSSPSSSTSRKPLCFQRGKPENSRFQEGGLQELEREIGKRNHPGVWAGVAKIYRKTQRALGRGPENPKCG